MIKLRATLNESKFICRFPREVTRRSHDSNFVPREGVESK
jgi:hypothetical protein